MNNLQLTSSKINATSDTFGALASGLCLLHCLATPFIFVVQAGTVSCHESGPMWWSIIDYIFLAVSFLAIYYSAKKTSSKWMPVALYTSWVLLAFFILNERFHFLHLSHAFLYLPAISLVGLHLYNRKYCQCVDEECCLEE